MSIESEKGNNINLEIPSDIPRHTHNGIDSVRVNVKDLRKYKTDEYFLDDIGGGSITGGNASGVPALPNPMYELEWYSVTVGDGSGGTKNIPVVDVLSINNVNSLLSDYTAWLEELKSRQEKLTRLLVQNGLVKREEITNTSPDFLRYPNMASFPSVGVVGKFYADDSDGSIYQWNTSLQDYEIAPLGWYSAFKYEL